MSRVTRGLSAALLAAATTFGAYTAQAQDLIVGVSWSNFQEERWKTDEAAIKAELERLGAGYIRSEERRVGKECVGRRIFRGSRYHTKKKQLKSMNAHINIINT